MAVLSDILGDEDHLGDMDFKVAGTEDGVTSLQMDIKITSITEDIMKTALAQAQDGRLVILKEMAGAISTAEEDVSQNAPRITVINISKIRYVKLSDQAERLSVKSVKPREPRLTSKTMAQSVTAVDESAAKEAAVNEIKNITAEPEVGVIYSGKVVKTVDFGAFVNFLGARDGLVHISELRPERVEKTTDIVKEGTKLKSSSLASMTGAR